MKCIYRGKEYDSITEACVAAWMAEAHEIGCIIGYYEQVEYPLTPVVKRKEMVSMKTKDKIVERTLLRECVYTADFVVYPYRAMRHKVDGMLFASDIAFEDSGFFKRSADGKINSCDFTGLLCDRDKPYVIDVKGERQPAAQAAKFSLTQKFLHYSTGIYVNKLVPCAREPKAKAKSFFMRCGLPADLPAECYRKDGQGFVQPWRDMFSGCPTIAEAMR